MSSTNTSQVGSHESSSVTIDGNYAGTVIAEPVRIHEIPSDAERCLATAVLASSTNTSQVNSRESSPVTTDSDDSGTLVEEPVQFSAAPWSDEVTDVTEQRDDVVVTSDSCNVTVTSDNCDVAGTVTPKSMKHLLTESSNGDVTTGVDEKDLRSTREASQPSPATVERYENTTHYVSSGKTPIVEQNNQRHVAVNLEAYMILGDKATSEKYSQEGEAVRLQVIDNQRYNEDKNEVYEFGRLSYDVFTRDVQTTSEEQLRQPKFQLETDDVQCVNDRSAENAAEASDVVRTEADTALQTSSDDDALTTTVDVRSNTEHVDDDCTQDIDPSYVAICPEIKHQPFIEDNDESKILEDKSCLVADDTRPPNSTATTWDIEEDLKATTDEVGPGDDEVDDNVYEEKRTKLITVDDKTTIYDFNDVWISGVQTTLEEHQLKTDDVQYSDNRHTEKAIEAPIVVRTDSPASTLQTASDNSPTLIEDSLTAVDDTCDIDHVDSEFGLDTGRSVVATCLQIHQQSLTEDKKKCGMSEISRLQVNELVLDHQELGAGDITRPLIIQVTGDDIDTVPDEMKRTNPLITDDDTMYNVDHLSYDVLTSDIQSEQQQKQLVCRFQTDNRSIESAVEAPDVVRAEADTAVSALQTSSDDAVLTEDVLTTTVGAKSNTEHVGDDCTQDKDPSYVAPSPEINHHLLAEAKDEGEILEDKSCLVATDVVEESRNVNGGDDMRPPISTATTWDTEEDLKATTNNVGPGDDDDDVDDGDDVYEKERTKPVTADDETVCDVNDIWTSGVQTTSEEQLIQLGCQLKTHDVQCSDNRSAENALEAPHVVRTEADSAASALQTSNDDSAAPKEHVLTALSNISHIGHVNSENRQYTDPSHVATCPQIHDQSLSGDKKKCEMSEVTSCLLMKDLSRDYQEPGGDVVSRPHVTEEDTQMTADYVPPQDDDADEHKRVKPLTVDNNTVYNVDCVKINIFTIDSQSEEQQQLVCRFQTNDVQYIRSTDSAVEAPVVVRTEATSDVSALQPVGNRFPVLTEDILTAVNNISHIDNVDSEYRQDTNPPHVATCPQIRDQSLPEDKETCEMAELSSCLLVNDLVLDHQELVDAGDITWPPVNLMIARQTEEDPQVTADDVVPGDDDVDDEMRVDSPTADDATFDIWSGDVQATSEEQLRDVACQLKTDDVQCSDDKYDKNVTEAPIVVRTHISASQADSDDAALTKSLLITVDVTSNTEHVEVNCTQDTDPSRVDRHRSDSDVDENQSLVTEEHRPKTVHSVVDNVTALEELENIIDDVEQRCCSDVAISAHVSCDKVDIEPRQTDVIPTTLVSPSSINRGGNDVILLPVSERHVTNLEMRQVEEILEMNDLREVLQTTDDSRPALVERANVESTVQTHNDSTSVTEGADIEDVDGLPGTDVVPVASSDTTLDSSMWSQNDARQQRTDQHLCIHLYDDLLLTDASGQTEFYVGQTKSDEPHEISLADVGEISDATALFDTSFVRDTVQSQRRLSDGHSDTEIFKHSSTTLTVSLISEDSVAVVESLASVVEVGNDTCPTVQSQRLPSDGHSNTEMFEQCSSTLTVSVTCDDSVAVVESSASAVEVTPATDESLDRPVSDRDKAEVDARLVMHDYAEMWSVFREIPLWVELLRAEIVERHNKDPRIARLLARYPSLRPSTWVWTTAPLVSDLHRATGRPADEPTGSRLTTCEHLGVSSCRSFDVEPVMERCTLVVTSSLDFVE